MHKFIPFVKTKISYFNTVKHFRRPLVVVKALVIVLVVVVGDAVLVVDSLANRHSSKTRYRS